MTHIEQAIRDAVEKGDYKVNHRIGWIESNEWCYQTVEGESKTYIQPTAEVFLDPLFWQALGKARGWDIAYGSYGWETAEEWKVNWHRFIDHLAEGKDAESFFAQLQ
jgi:hypothetical protein